MHVYRERNRATYWLGNHGVSQLSPLTIMNFAPSGLDTIIGKDARGVGFPRFINP